jgi:hypothetical protein
MLMNQNGPLRLHTRSAQSGVTAIWLDVEFAKH